LNKIITLSALAGGLALAGAAFAEPYTDWTPTKGAWEVTTVKVEPSHVDDYLTGLKKGWVAGQEVAKAHGVIDRYMVLVKLNGSAGANVQMIVHYPSLAMMEPDKARDQAIDKETSAKVSKDDDKKAVAEYDKYRTFVSDEIWTSVDFGK
jgi:hypothetical protein